MFQVLDTLLKNPVTLVTLLTLLVGGFGYILYALVDRYSSADYKKVIDDAGSAIIDRLLRRVEQLEQGLEEVKKELKDRDREISVLHQIIDNSILLELPIALFLRDTIVFASTRLDTLFDEDTTTTFKEYYQDLPNNFKEAHLANNGKAVLHKVWSGFEYYPIPRLNTEVKFLVIKLAVKRESSSMVAAIYVKYDEKTFN